jgi:hypothetical protein
VVDISPEKRPYSFGNLLHLQIYAGVFWLAFLTTATLLLLLSIKNFMRNRMFFCSVMCCTIIAACNNAGTTGSPKPTAMNNSDSIKKELAVIDSLLQDKPFTKAMAQELEAAYHKGIGEPVPLFLKPGEDSLEIEKSIKEEKIATNIAAFYALECGINYFCSKDSSTPADWIEKITSGKLSGPEAALFDRFANATWKAGQPFREMERIKKSNFIGWSGLSNEEIQKDTRQIINAAIKLQLSIRGTKEEQLQQIKRLLQDKSFSYQMAVFMDSCYWTGEHKAVQPFILKEEETATKKKSFKEEKIATNVAGFYALECGVNYLVSSKKQAPSIILQSIINNSISKEDKMLFTRFANATWKAGQPFRGLDRITRDIFVPFNFLSDTEVEKDWVQVRAAAAKLLAAIKQS